MNPIKLKKDPQGGYLVTQGDLDSGCLAPDEALGIIAHALYGDGSPHRFLKPQAIPPPKLLPCPHCGREDSLKIKTDDITKYAQVICDASTRNNHKGCGSSSGYMRYQKEAVDAWNRRAAGSVNIDYRLHKPEIEGTENE